MNRTRGLLVLIQIMAFMFLALWIYAGHLYDGFNVGNKKGDINLWLGILAVGAWGTVIAWLLSIGISLSGTCLNKFRTRREGVIWIIVAIIAAPTVAMVAWF